jgi:prepilin-type N-terminal cleavage/methylation domain-containing protein
MKHYKKQDNKLSMAGFTLIELLVVILILSTLSGIILTVLNSTGVQGKARDSQRMGDLKRIQTALELMYSDTRSYPIQADWAAADTALSTPLSSYLNPIPTDPIFLTGVDPCSGDSMKYMYRSTGSRYIIAARMEVATSDDSGRCNSLPNWDHASFSPANCALPATVNCYGVQNP